MASSDSLAVDSNFFSSEKGGSRIKVAVRVRPMLDHERNNGHTT
jgi:hypothetical protein